MDNEFSLCDACGFNAACPNYLPETIVAECSSSGPSDGHCYLRDAEYIASDEWRNRYPQLYLPTSIAKL